MKESPYKILCKTAKNLVFGKVYVFEINTPNRHPLLPFMFRLNDNAEILLTKKCKVPSKRHFRLKKRLIFTSLTGSCDISYVRNSPYVEHKKVG